MATSTIKAISEDISSSIDSTKVDTVYYAYRNGRMVTFSIAVNVTLDDKQKIVSGVFKNNKPIAITSCNLSSGSKANHTGINVFILADGNLAFRGNDPVVGETFFISGSFITSGG